MIHRTPPAVRRRLARTTIPLLVAGSLVALAGPASAQVLPAADPSGACTDPTGVTVVVDLTDLGGEVEIGCADAPATGTEALQAAGFVDTRDASGMICAIDALPDPCPATFEGSYWSYWYAEPGGEWQTYMEGSDTAVPAAGAVEGWRYDDGSLPPSIDPPSAAAQETEATDEESATPEAETTTPAPISAVDDTDSSSTLPTLVGIGGVAVLVAAGVLVARRRRTLDQD